jgi:hypothetical protein
MVDFKLAYRSNERLRWIEQLKFRGGVIDEPTIEDVAEVQGFDDLTDETEIIFDDPQADRQKWLQWSRETQLLEKRSPDTLTDECYNLFPARAWGYVFLRRKWCKTSTPITVLKKQNTELTVILV